MEAFLNVLVCSQNQHGAVGRETGLRRNDRHGEVSVLLDGQYAHMMPFPDIQLADGLADPVIRNLNLKDGMIVPQRDIVRNIIRAVSDGGPDRDLPLWVDDLVRPVSQQEFGLNVPCRPGPPPFSPPPPSAGKPSPENSGNYRR